MRKITFIALLFAMSLSSIHADAAGKFYFGGGVGLSLNDNATNFEVSPLVGYRITPPWSVGVQLYYKYLNDSDYIRQNGYGGGVFTRYDVSVPIPGINRIIPAILLQAEYDYIHYKNHYKASNLDTTSDYNMLPIGAGVYLGSGRSRLSIAALWDMLHLDENSGKPTLRLAIIF